MSSFNKVILLGNLTRDPELRYTPKGAAIANTAIAINRRWKDAETAEAREDVTYVELEVWGKQAEVMSKHTRCGSGLHIEGRLVLQQWEDKETQKKRSQLKVHVESFQFVGRPPEGDAPASSKEAE